jgi:iron-sulfur cluster assembly accessory protein
MDVIITAAAERFIRRMLRMSGATDSGFRLVVTSGGCSGLSGAFSVEPRPLPGDAVYEHGGYGGIKFFLPAESRLLLDGITIDFADTSTQTGLVFRDPKTAASSCGSTIGGSAAGALPGVASIAISSIGRRH